MTTRPQPEAIRGSWYLLPEDGSLEEAVADNGQLLALGLDGNFTRYDISSGAKEENETGDYTFDGDFLIVRGRNTHTYRVGIEAQWYWFLEAKKKSRRLYRGLLEPGDFFTLDDEERHAIANSAKRASVQCRWEDETDAIFEVAYNPRRGKEFRIGTFSVDPEPQEGALWVGVTSLASNLGAEAWQKVIRTAYFDTHLGEPDEVSTVVVEVLNSGERGAFDY